MTFPLSISEQLLLTNLISEQRLSVLRVVDHKRCFTAPITLNFVRLSAASSTGVVLVASLLPPSAEVFTASPPIPLDIVTPAYLLGGSFKFFRSSFHCRQLATLPGSRCPVHMD